MRTLFGKSKWCFQLSATVLSITLVLTTAAMCQSIPSKLVTYPELILHNGKVLTVDDRFSIVQAVALGSIAEGKLGDLVVLGGDYLEVPADKIGELPIDLTIVGGKIVYDRARDCFITSRRSRIEQ